MSGQTEGVRPAFTAPPGANGRRNSSSGLPLRVLLVIQDQDDAKTIKSLLKEVRTESYEVNWVNTYDSAHVTLDRDEYDVCLLDSQLEGRTGLELLNSYKDRDRIPFLFLSSQEEHAVDVTLGRAGAADYLVKTHLNGPLLERAIRYALERKTAEWDIREAQRLTEATLDALQRAHSELEERVQERTAALVESNHFLEAEIVQKESAQREMHSRMRQQEVVALLGQRALAGVDFPILFTGAVTLASATLKVHHGWFLEKLPTLDYLQLRAQVGFADENWLRTGLKEGKGSQSGYTLLIGEPVICENLRDEDRFTPSRDIIDSGVVSSITVVVKADEVPLGVMGMGSSTVRSFDQNDIHFLQAIANLLGAAIARNRIESEVLQLNEELQFSNHQLKEEILERQAAVAALKESAEALEQAKQQAEEANRAKSDFLSRMSHELRTPLNSILGFSQILNMQKLSPEQHGDVAHILRAGQHLLGLINEVLDIARIEAGRMSLSPESIQVSQILMETVELVRPLAKQRDIRLENEVPLNANLYVRADRQRLKQVLLNLLSNAIKYNRDGGIVTVRTNVARGTSGHADNFHSIEVSDTGAGLTAEEISRLFVPFERLGAENGPIEGTGIGLALCKRIVEAMDGQVGVESQPGEGCNFWVDLPRTVPQELSEDLLAESGIGIKSFHARQSKCILYIEDNLANLTVVTRALSTNGSHDKIITAMQGSVGLDMARQHQPDLVLLDFHLPDIEGDVVLKRLRAEPVTAQIPVVILSADATPGQVDRMISAGADAYLHKPLDVPLFLRTLQDLLKRSDP